MPRRGWPVLAVLIGLAGCAVQPGAPPVAGTNVSGNFIALGTEPFWSVEVLPGKLRYSTPDDIAGVTFAASHHSTPRGQVHAGTLKGAPFRLSIEPGQCSDGMSDTVYAWKARVTHGALVLQGCARRAGL